MFGSILDAWQVPTVEVGPAGDDQGKGDKYLLLPPDFKGEVPTGHFPVRSATYNGYTIFRAIPHTRSDEDTAKALALVKQLRLYPLAQVANPPAQRYIDISGKLFDGIAKFDDTFYDSLAKMVNEEPVQMHNMVTMGQLRSIGIEKDKEFKPDAATRAIPTRPSPRRTQVSWVRPCGSRPTGPVRVQAFLTTMPLVYGKREEKPSRECDTFTAMLIVKGNTDANVEECQTRFYYLPAGSIPSTQALSALSPSTSPAASGRDSRGSPALRPSNSSYFPAYRAINRVNSPRILRS